MSDLHKLPGEWRAKNEKLSKMTPKHPCQQERWEAICETREQCADELEAALKPRPIETAPHVTPLLCLFCIEVATPYWRIAERVGNRWYNETGEVFPDYWLPLPAPPEVE